MVGRLCLRPFQQSEHSWRVMVAALIVGFALALGVALNELDAAVKGIGSSLARIATIGN
jgi:hypothetical protein